MLNWNNKCMVILHTVFLFSSPYVWSEEIIIQSTTSTKNSGFYDFMMPKIKEATNLNIKVVAVGTGQAIENSMRCDGDVLLVHDKEAEIEFVRKGYGLIRYDLMFNDFVIVFIVFNFHCITPGFLYYLYSIFYCKFYIFITSFWHISN